MFCNLIPFHYSSFLFTRHWEPINCHLSVIIYCFSFASENNVESHVSWWLHGDNEKIFMGIWDLS